MNCTRRVSCRNAAIEEARNISPSPTPTTSGVWQRAPTSVSVVVAVDGDDREVALELCVGLRGRRRRGRPRSGARSGARRPRRRSPRRRCARRRRATLSARGSSRRSRSGRSTSRAVVAAGERVRVRRARRAPWVAQRVCPTPGRRARSGCARPRASASGGSRPRGRTRARRPRAARSPPSRSRGTPGARAR